MDFRRPMCCFALGFLLMVSILFYAFHFIPQDYDDLGNLKDGETVSFCALIRDKTIREDGVVLYVSTHGDGSYVSKKGHGLILYLSEEMRDIAQSLPVGSEISASGRIYRFDMAENFGQFNTRQYYYIRGYHARIVNCTIPACNYKAGIKDALWRLKMRIKAIYGQYLNETDAGIMTAIMLGDKTELDSEIKNLYQTSGIIHILSLSGLHIATLGLALMKILTNLLRKVFAGTRLCNDLTYGGRKTTLAAGTVSSLAMLLYCIMTGMSISTVRALIMYVLGLAARVAERSYDLLSAAALSSVIVVIINPLYIYDASFQLSFAAIISIGMIYPELLKMFDRAADGKIIQGLLLSISIQIGTFPITAYHYYQIPIMGILLNLIVVPLMSLVLMCGTGLALLGGLNIIGMIFGKIAHVTFWVYEQLTMVSSGFKWNMIITGKPQIGQVIVYYCIILAGFCVAGRLSYVDQIGRRFIGHKRKNNKILQMQILCGFVMSACVIVMLGHHYGYMVRNLSVGQGDCTVITNKTHVIIVDCGSSTKDKVGTYRLIPSLKANAISDIDTIFISHFDSDHVIGILELLSDDFFGRRIGRIIISKAAPIFDADKEAYTQLVEHSITHDIPIYTVSAGDKFTIGDSLVSCLSPRNDCLGEYKDTNAASLVLDIRDIVSGYHILLTGDIGEETESLICRDCFDSATSCDYDYLKIAHHGSDSSTSERFLDVVKARMCVISVGEGNERTTKMIQA